MSDDALADPRTPLQTSSNPGTNGRAPAGAPAAEEAVASPRRRLETLMELVARRSEKPTAAERLLAELEAARAERD